MDDTRVAKSDNRSAEFMGKSDCDEGIGIGIVLGNREAYRGAADKRGDTARRRPRPPSNA